MVWGGICVYSRTGSKRETPSGEDTVANHLSRVPPLALADNNTSCCASVSDSPFLFIEQQLLEQT